MLAFQENTFRNRSRPGARDAQALSAQKEADLIAQTLRDARFDVTVIRDFRMPDFLVNGVRPFLNKLRPNDVALIYYSGYAIQIVDDVGHLCELHCSSERN